MLLAQLFGVVKYGGMKSGRDDDSSIDCFGRACDDSASEGQGLCGAIIQKGAKGMEFALWDGSVHTGKQRGIEGVGCAAGDKDDVKLCGELAEVDQLMESTVAGREDEGGAGRVCSDDGTG